MLERIDPSWAPLFKRYEIEIASIWSRIEGQEVVPHKTQIFRVFEKPISHYRVVIVGQDPYPTPGFANGLAFSVDSSISKIPASLRNIFSEYCTDMGYAAPLSGDLTSWADAGVLLLNSNLTLNLLDKGEHLRIGWQIFTSAVLSELNERGAIAILWGAHAQKAGAIFPKNRKLESVHPSPLSAYRGFFGSKPFSRTNALLRNGGLPVVDWELK